MKNKVTQKKLNSMTKDLSSLFEKIQILGKEDTGQDGLFVAGIIRGVYELTPELIFCLTELKTLREQLQPKWREGDIIIEDGDDTKWEITEVRGRVLFDGGSFTPQISYDLESYPRFETYRPDVPAIDIVHYTRVITDKDAT